MYKTAAAALHLFNASASDNTVTQDSLVVSLSNGTGTLLAAYSNQTVVLAFNVRPPLALLATWKEREGPGVRGCGGGSSSWKTMLPLIAHKSRKNDALL